MADRPRRLEFMRLAVGFADFELLFKCLARTHIRCPELLATKSPAARFYFLEILKRLDALPLERIKHVGAEAAMAGQSGLNYASPDKTNSVPSYGPEKLSGLEVMCIMFAAFQRVAPQHDIGIALHEPYMKALALHEAKKRNGP